MRVYVLIMIDDGELASCQVFASLEEADRALQHERLLQEQAGNCEMLYYIKERGIGQGEW